MFKGQRLRGTGTLQASPPLNNMRLPAEYSKAISDAVKLVTSSTRYS